MHDPTAVGFVSTCIGFKDVYTNVFNVRARHAATSWSYLTSIMGSGPLALCSIQPRIILPGTEVLYTCVVVIDYADPALPL